jgi:hypothetical protein
MSFESSYERVPDLLRGYVELVYDLHSRPLLRLVESLLYRSDHLPHAVAEHRAAGPLR